MLLDVGPCAAPVDVQVPDDDQLRNERLKKKKKVQTRSSLRPRTWLDKEKRKEQSTKKTKLQESHGSQAQVAEDSTFEHNMRDFQQYEITNSFTQLLQETDCSPTSRGADCRWSQQLHSATAMVQNRTTGVPCTRSRLAVVSAGCGPSSTRDVTRWWGHRPERAKQLQASGLGRGRRRPDGPKQNKQGSPTAEACPRIWPVAFYWSSSGLPLLRRQMYQMK